MPWTHGVFGHNTARVTKFEQVTGRKVDQLGVFPSRGSWASINDTWWLNTAPAGFKGTLDVAVPLWQKDGNLATAAAGGYNAQWEALGRKIEAKYPGSTVRIGWEFNIGGWDHRATPANVAQWKQAFQQASTSLRKGGPSTLIVFNPNKGKGDSLPDATQAYPGDAYVDIIGIDAYDWWPGYTAATWPKHRDENQGWQFWLDFAKAHNKKFAVPEWGVAPGNSNGGGDNPFYITTVLDFLDQNREHVHSAVYFDEPAAYIKSSLAEGQAPKAAAAFKSKTAEIAAKTGTTSPTTAPPPTGSSTAPPPTGSTAPTVPPTTSPTTIPDPGAGDGDGWALLQIPKSWLRQWGQDGAPEAPTEPPPSEAPTAGPLGVPAAATETGDAAEGTGDEPATDEGGASGQGYAPEGTDEGAEGPDGEVTTPADGEGEDAPTEGDSGATAEETTDPGATAEDPPATAAPEPAPTTDGQPIPLDPSKWRWVQVLVPDWFGDPFKVFNRGDGEVTAPSTTPATPESGQVNAAAA